MAQLLKSWECMFKRDSCMASDNTYPYVFRVCLWFICVNDVYEIWMHKSPRNWCDSDVFPKHSETWSIIGISPYMSQISNIWYDFRQVHSSHYINAWLVAAEIIQSSETLSWYSYQMLQAQRQTLIKELLITDRPTVAGNDDHLTPANKSALCMEHVI